jgi:hypothetical protein
MGMKGNYLEFLLNSLLFALFFRKYLSLRFEYLADISATIIIPCDDISPYT